MTRCGMWLVPVLALWVTDALAIEREASQPYRPLGETQQWIIAGTMHGPLKVALRINGQMIFDSSMDDDLSGMYRDKAVRAICTTHAGFVGRKDMSCQIYVADELAANLVFMKG